MKSLKQLCTPRDSVFDTSKRDTVLNLAHLIDDKIDGKAFFEENYVTDGMRTLLVEAFRRLQKKSEQSVFKLTQAMGGGKTHNLITLGMLAKNPEYRAQVLRELPAAKDLPRVRVVAFSGRETDVPHGIWGEIARQLGKFDAFKDYYQRSKLRGVPLGSIYLRASRRSFFSTSFHLTWTMLNQFPSVIPTLRR